MKLLTTEESMYSCVRCGACRDACPTLDITGKEADGPRGRVLMSRSVIEGVIPINDEIEKQLDRCLLCSACVDACPLDVAVPDIVMMAKEKIQESRKKPWGQQILLDFFLERILPYTNRLQKLGNLLWFYQRSGLQQLVRKLGILHLISASMREMEGVLPEIPAPRERKAHPVFSNHSMGESGNKVAMFQGCIMDVLFRKTNDHTIQLLNMSGFDVITPADQVCCGALHAHNGSKDIARELAKKNIQAFETTGAHYIISNAGGCGAMLHEYEELFRDDPEWVERARVFSSKVRDVSEIIVKEGTLPAVAGNGERITFQPSCHLQYVMGVKDAPQKLLRKIDNIVFVELPDAKYCCGSAGIYNILQPDLAGDILDKKMKNAKKTAASVMITANPGCLLQMRLGIARENRESDMEAYHIVDYLMERVEQAKLETRNQDQPRVKHL